MLTYDGPITSVPQLLALHDRNFVNAAYVSVLGREPDPAGASYYLARLRSGTHKLQILKQLRRSAEGRAFVPAVAGLDRAIKRHSWATLAIIGPILRFFMGEEGNGPLDRQLRMVTNLLGGIQAEQAWVLGEVAGLRSEHAALATSLQGASLGGGTPHAPPPTDRSPLSAPPPLPISRHSEHAPIALDSAERRILSTLHAFSSTRGAAL